ncbi:MAG: TIGR04282 family arsenosugar biosynthesis glycosyltransferase [Rhodobacteraceae bacterium]|nr:TIGR04282 family arsenosugar biosynthesis glycosyltransferase [Paracoccaceae bacterium]
MHSLPENRSGRWLVIFVKDPRPGRVKTRLAKDLGAVAASAWYHRQTQRLIRSVGSDTRWRTLLAVAPDKAVHDSQAWPLQIPRLAQGGGSLGDRMQRVFLSLPPGDIAIIGSDIPAIDRKRVAAAFRLLRGHGTVFGPCSDGGFWLIAMGRFRRHPGGLFNDVRWSSQFALADSVRSLRGRSIQYADTLRDVDTIDDFHAAEKT